MTQKQTARARRKQTAEESHPLTGKLADVETIDEILDSIDEILEENACEVLMRNRQQGGE
jgi:ubiquitin-like protein Pup